jgi:hypothetical protein
MARNFGKYVQRRNRLELATALVENGVDVPAWVQHVKDLVSNYDLTEAQLLSELGGFGGMMRTGMAGLGGIAGAGAGAVGGAIGRGAQAVKGAIGKGARAVQAAGQNVANNWQQQAQGSQIKQAIAHIDELEQFLVKSQITTPEVISPYLNKLKQVLTQVGGNVAGNSSLRFGQGGASFGSKQNAPQAQGSGI